MRTPSGLGSAARNLLHDWGFPFVLLAAWIAATSYTLFLVVGGEPPAQQTAIATAPPRLPVVQNAAARKVNLPKS